MKRVFVTCCVFLLLGAIVNVAVAWTIALSLDVGEGESKFRIIQSSDDHWYISQRWRCGASKWLSHRYGERQHGIHRSTSQSLELDGEWLMFRSRLYEHPPRSQWIANARGWPAPALWSEQIRRPPDPVVWRHGFLTDLPLFDSGPSRHLPLRPLWPGFAINTLFYAAILWLLFAAPFTIRRWRRIKRGLCVKCAYPVGASDVCTECGAHINKKIKARGSMGLPPPATPASGNEPIT